VAIKGEKVINKLKILSRDELNDREFYTSILDIIYELNDIGLTPKGHEMLVNSLKEIGCTRYSDFEKSQSEKGEKIEKISWDKTIADANIQGAVILIDQIFMGSSNAGMVLSAVCEGGKRSDLAMWLENSERILETEKAFKNKGIKDSQEERIAQLKQEKNIQTSKEEQQH